MSLTVQDAIQELTNNPTAYATIDALRALANQVSVEATGDVTVLYSGRLSDGTSTSDLIKNMLASGENIKVIDKTPVAEFLTSDEFLEAVGNIYGVELKDMQNENFSHPAKDWLFDAKNGPWADASYRFAMDASGDVRVIAPEALSDRVFAKTELPALLANDNVTAIEGIPKDQLKALGDPEAIFKAIKVASFQHMALTGLHYDKDATHAADDFLQEITDTEGYLAQHPEANGRFKLASDTLADDQKAYFKAFSEAMADSPHGLSTGGKLLNKLGVVGGLMGFALAYSDAASAAESGDIEQAKEIMAQWAVDESGSAAGEALGAVIAGVAVAAAGAALAAPVAAGIIIGGSLVGGFFGADGAAGLYELFKDKNDNDRSDIIDKLADLLFGDNGATALPADLNGNNLTFIPAFDLGQIIANAKNDMGWRYALQQLNPFAINDISYNQHNTDGSLDLYNSATGAGVMTEQWLVDRARFVVLVAKASETFVPNWLLSTSYYQDLASGTQIGIPIGTDKYIFGGDGADTVEGGLRNDHLYGGKGNDTLTGSGGNDYLEGGLGDDTYLYNSGDGIDTITDHSGSNQITVNGAVVSGVFSPSFSGGQIYFSTDKTYSLQQMAGGTYRLLVRDATSQEYQAVADLVGWQSGEFGISTGTAASESRVLLSLPNSIANLHMDGSLATQGVEFDGGTKSDSFIGSSRNDIIRTGGGLSNFVSNAYAGDDKVTGGDSQDFIRTGNTSGTSLSDNDFAEGGAKSDVLLGGYGSDQLWGDTANGIWQAVTSGSGDQGDWLSGENGNDSLYGSSSRDVLFGGAGEDLIQGGAGNDLLLGDAQYSMYSRATGLPSASPYTQSFKWDANTNTMIRATYSLAPVMVVSGDAFKWVCTMTDNDYTLTVPTGFVVEQRLATGGGNDVMYGGVGNDWMAGQTGDDYLEGGDGNDILYGDDKNGLMAATDQGNDVLMGGKDTDTLYGGNGDDILGGGAGDDSIDGGLGKDTIFFNRGDGIDTVTDPDKDTVLIFGDGISKDDIRLHLGSLAIDLGNGDQIHIAGFDPNNAFSSSSISNFRFADGSQLTLAGLLALGFDIIGTAADDILTGTNVNDRIQGLAGNDSLNGGDGVDYLAGGTGDDTYVVGTGDTVTEALDEGTDTVQTDISYTLGNHVENLVLLGTTAINGTGNSLNNNLVGNSAGNILDDGGAGIDTMAGGAGDDLYIVNNSLDIVTEDAGAGMDTVNASVAYVLSGNVENLTLTGAAAVNGTGNALDNILVGNSAANTLIGGAGNDTYVVGAGDSVTEALNEGTDTVQTDINYTLANNVENLILIGTAAINGKGNSLNNSLIGNNANNTLDGAAGMDTMAGGAGNDLYLVNTALDTVIEAVDAGKDTVNASVTYTLSGNVENLTLTGAAAINGTGNSLDNVLIGNNATNILIGGAGNDTYVVGIGDIVTEALNEGTDTVQANITYSLAGNVENLTLTGAGAINGTGNALDNILIGNNAANTLMGGTGNDTYVIGAGDTVAEALNEGTDTVQTNITYTLAGNVENLTLTGVAAVNGTGNILDNILVGNSAANSLIGGAGNDTYVVGAGDTVTEALNEGADTVQTDIAYTLGINIENLTLTGVAAINGTGNALDNTLVGNSAANSLIGGTGNDTYVVGAGDTVTEALDEGTDTVQTDISYTLGSNLENLSLIGDAVINATGNTLANLLSGNAAANTLNGGAGADRMLGGLGNDLYVVDNIGDTVQENVGEGVDKVQSTISYVLGANVENLSLFGSKAINGTGNVLGNILVGNAANNVLDGGIGADTLTGGLGSDVFVFGALGSADKVTDFVAGTDKLQLLDGVAGLAVGNTDHVIDNATLTASGGFASSAELVIASQNISGTFSTAKAAAVIGSAANAYALSDTRLFVVDNGVDSAVYLFKSAGADALVSSTELTLVGTLQGAAQMGFADLMFA